MLRTALAWQSATVRSTGYGFLLRCPGAAHCGDQARLAGVLRVVPGISQKKWLEDMRYVALVRSSVSPRHPDEAMAVRSLRKGETYVWAF